MEDDLLKLHWLKIKKRIVYKLALLALNSLMGVSPICIQDMFSNAHYGHKLRLITPTSKTKYGQRSFCVAASKIYNMLPSSVTSSESIHLFKNKLKTFLFALSDVEFDNIYRA